MSQAEKAKGSSLPNMLLLLYNMIIMWQYTTEKKETREAKEDTGKWAVRNQPSSHHLETLSYRQQLTTACYCTHQARTAPGTFWLCYIFKYFLGRYIRTETGHQRASKPLLRANCFLWKKEMGYQS